MLLTWQRRLRDFDVEMRGRVEVCFCLRISRSVDRSTNLQPVLRFGEIRVALSHPCLHRRELLRMVTLHLRKLVSVQRAQSAVTAAAASSSVREIEGAGNGRTPARGVPAKVSKAVCGEIEGAKRRVTPGKTHGESDSKVSSDSCKEGKE